MTSLTEKTTTMLSVFSMRHPVSILVSKEGLAARINCVKRQVNCKYTGHPKACINSVKITSILITNEGLPALMQMCENQLCEKTSKL